MLAVFGRIITRMTTFVIVCCWFAALRKIEGASCNPQFHNMEEVRNSTRIAKQLVLGNDNRVPISDRLVVNILFSRGFFPNHNSQGRLQYLKCALLKLKHNLMVNTTVDVFIWTLNTTDIFPIIPDWINNELLPRVYIMEIPPETWKVPCGLIPDSHWVVRNKFDVDYYMMGRWRLAFSMDFAREMGYGYHLQFDDDAMLNGPLKYDIVQSLKQSQIEMGVFSDLIGEVAHVTLGLPEITRYWMKIRNFSPKGELFKHLKPSDINGLTSDGWDRMYHPGYFLILSVEFWFQEHIQDYLTTIFRSGRDIEGRWQEQAVINMMRLVFVAPERMRRMDDVDIGHDRHKKERFIEWCVKSGVMPS